MWFIIGGAIILVALLMIILARSISNADSRQKEWEDTGPHPSIYVETHGRLEAIRPPQTTEAGSSAQQQHVHVYPGQQPQHQQAQHVPNFDPGPHSFGSGMQGGGHY